MQGWFEFKGLYFDVDSKRSDKKGHKSNKYSIQTSFFGKMMAILIHTYCNKKQLNSNSSNSIREIDSFDVGSPIQKAILMR